MGLDTAYGAFSRWRDAFLMMGKTFICGREDPSLKLTVRNRLAAGTMNAKYDPGEVAFPECQPFKKEN